MKFKIFYKIFYEIFKILIYLWIDFLETNKNKN